MEKFIRVEYNDKIYEVEVEKLVYALNILEKGNVKETEEELRNLLDKYDLYDDIFLTTINKLW